jgi:hypothetical protein
MSEGLLIALFVWSVAQGDWLEASVLALRWAFLLYRAFTSVPLEA